MAINRIIVMMLSTITRALSSEVDGHIVQFVVYAPQESDITHLFPGANVQFTWNNVYVVQMWTHDPTGLIPEIQAVLSKNESIIQTIEPPLTLAASTQKRLEYNLVWATMLLLIFLSGCACGGLAIHKCLSIKQAVRGKRPACHTGC